MSDDLSGPTSDVGQLYRSELQRRGVPMLNSNLQALINESRRNPGIIPGLEGVQGLDTGVTPKSQSGGTPNVAGGQVGSPARLPTPPMPPSYAIDQAVGMPQPPPPVSMGGPPQGSAPPPSAPLVSVKQSMFDREPVGPSVAPSAPQVASTVLNSTLPSTAVEQDYRMAPIQDSGPGIIPRLIDRFVRGMGSTPPPETPQSIEARREFGGAPPASTAPAIDPATVASIVASGAGVGGGTLLANQLIGNRTRTPATPTPAPTPPAYPNPAAALIPPHERAGMPGSPTTLTPNNIPQPTTPANPDATATTAAQNSTVQSQRQAQAAQEARDLMARQAATNAMRETAGGVTTQGPPGTASASPPPDTPKTPNQTMTASENSFFTKAYQDGIKNGMSPAQAQERAANILRQFKVGGMRGPRLR